MNKIISVSIVALALLWGCNKTGESSIDVYSPDQNSTAMGSDSPDPSGGENSDDVDNGGLSQAVELSSDAGVSIPGGTSEQNDLSSVTLISSAELPSSDAGDNPTPSSTVPVETPSSAEPVGGDGIGIMGCENDYGCFVGTEAYRRCDHVDSDSSLFGTPVDECGVQKAVDGNTWCVIGDWWVQVAYAGNDCDYIPDAVTYYDDFHIGVGDPSYDPDEHMMVSYPDK